MADYIYLLQTRLSTAQQKAVDAIRTMARENEVTLFLTGGAVRDLTGGGSVRDLDFTVQGEVAALRAGAERAGATVYGENGPARRLFLMFPGGTRVELSSASSVSYPKPGQPEYAPGNLADDLRSRDFTANAMAISLNDGSYGLLIDPLNGVADIENRELRLVSNYGFIEDPSRLIRAARLSSRLGWQMEERTRQRYDTAKEEGYISALSAWNRGYELEEIFHEEDPVRILRALEAEQWMKDLFPALDAAKANSNALSEIAERQGQLQTQGLLAQSAALAFPLVTAKLSAADVTALKGLFVRPGFVREIESLDARTREFATRFASKEAALPSAAWRMLHEAEPNLILSLAYGTKTASVQSRLKVFLTESPTARQRIPYALLQEMRITPDLSGYEDLIEKLFFELMDGKLASTEDMKAFLEPYSPPAPPPPVNLRRARAKKEVRPSRAKSKKAAEAELSAPLEDADEADLSETDDDELEVSPTAESESAPALQADPEMDEDPESEPSAPVAKVQKAPAKPEDALATPPLPKESSKSKAGEPRAGKAVAAPSKAGAKKLAEQPEKVSAPVRQVITITSPQDATRTKVAKSAVAAKNVPKEPAKTQTAAAPVKKAAEPVRKAAVKAVPPASKQVVVAKKAVGKVAPSKGAATPVPAKTAPGGKAATKAGSRSR